MLLERSCKIFTGIPTSRQMRQLKITVNHEIGEFCKPVTLFGKVIYSALGRDSGMWPGENVSYIKGKAKSGGSVKNWRSVVEEGSVIILTNVNKNIFDKEKNYRKEFIREKMGGMKRER